MSSRDHDQNLNQHPGYRSGSVNPGKVKLEGSGGQKLPQNDDAGFGGDRDPRAQDTRKR